MQFYSEVALVSEIIGEFYDAAREPKGWEPALNKLCALVDGKTAVIQMLDPFHSSAPRMWIDHGIDRKWSELLHTTFAALCPIRPMLVLAEVDQPDTIYNYIDETEYRETRFYREWCAPQECCEMAGAIIAKSVKEVGTFSVNRSEQKPRFSKGDIELLGIIAPHVRRAVTIAGLLEHRAVEADALRTIMDRLKVAVILLTSTAQVLKANVAGEELLARGGPIARIDGRLGLRNRAAEQALAAALASNLRDPVTLTIEAPGEGAAVREKLSAAILPLPGTPATFAMLLHVPEPALPATAKPLIAAFGFTPREIAVVMPLLEGKSITEVAEILGVSQATARTHLQRLLEKTGTSRQADLIRVVLQAMPPVRL